MQDDKKIIQESNGKIPLFLICDDNYCSYMSVMIASVCANTEYYLDFHVVGKGISEENKKKIEKMKEKFSNFDINYKTFDITAFYNIPYLRLPRMTLSTYIRMVLPDLYRELKRALVMDIDLILLDDISKLWFQDLNSYIFAAALDKPFDAYYSFKKNLEVDIECKYANCGVMLIDFEKWRSNNITTQCLDIEKQYRDKLNCADQDVINKVFLGNFKELECKYNSLLGIEEDIIVRHFCYLRKPWLSKYNVEGDLIKNFDDWWKYAEISPFYEELLAKYLEINRGGGSLKNTINTYRNMVIASSIRNVIKKQKVYNKEA